MERIKALMPDYLGERLNQNLLAKEIYCAYTSDPCLQSVSQLHL